MFRWLFYLLIAAAFAVFAGWVARVPGTVSMEWHGYRIESSVAVLILAIVLVIVIVLVLYRFWSGLTRAPGGWMRAHREHRRRRGYEALSKGLVAIAAGDTAAANKQAHRAATLVDDRPLTLLLSAQAAQLQGDDQSATRYFKAMRQQASTEFLGVRGLLTQAMKRHDDAEALKLAERAHRLNPKSEWVVSTLYALQRRLGHWADAEATLEKSVKLKVVSEGEAPRQRAELLSLQSEQDDDLNTASRAFKADPSYTPAATRYARMLVNNGLQSRACTVIERAWEANPHTDLAEIYWDARECTDAAKRFDAARRLTTRNPQHIESRLIVASTALDAQQWSDARAALAPVAEDGAPPQVCRLMAQLEEREHGDLARARTWLMRASGDQQLDHYTSSTLSPGLSPAAGTHVNDPLGGETLTEQR